MVYLFQRILVKNNLAKAVEDYKKEKEKIFKMIEDKSVGATSARNDK